MGGLNLSAKNTHRIVGIVHREAISYEDVLNRIRLLLMSSGQPMTPDFIRQFYSQALRQLIDEVLQRRLASQFVKLEPDDIQERIQDIEKRSQMPVGGLSEILKQQGVSFASFKKQMETNLLWSKYIERKYSSLLNISQQDVEKFKEKWKKDHKQKQYQLAEIVFYVSPDQNPHPIRAQAQKILEWLYQGAAFGKIAQQFSQAPSREAGGILGWRGLNRIDPALHEIVQTATIGDFVGPIDIPSHKHPSKIVLLVVLDRRDPEDLKLKEPDDASIQAILRGDILERWSRKEIEDLRKKEHYEVRVEKDSPIQGPSEQSSSQQVP